MVIDRPLVVRVPFFKPVQYPVRSGCVETQRNSPPKEESLPGSLPTMAARSLATTFRPLSGQEFTRLNLF